MNQFLIRLVCCFVPKRELRHFLRCCRFGQYKVKGKNNKKPPLAITIASGGKIDTYFSQCRD